MGGGGVANLQRHLRVWSLWSNCNEGEGGVKKGPKTVVDLSTQPLTVQFKTLNISLSLDQDFGTILVMCFPQYLVPFQKNLKH